MIKKTLNINLTKQTYEVKSNAEINKYIGGVGIGLKLLLDYLEEDPIIFSVGPLNGFFPFASKTSLVFEEDGTVEDLYIGGSLSTRIRFAGLDSIVISGKSLSPVILDIMDGHVTFKEGSTDIETLGLPAKRSVIKPVMDKFVLDEHFTTPEYLLETKLSKKNVRGIVVTGTKTYPIQDNEKYTDQFMKILTSMDKLTVAKGNNPSCSGCPAGCIKSKVGEIGGNVLTHSLVACAFAEPIYSNIGIVFSCLNILGYDYTHEDIEALPELIHKTLRELS